MTAITDLARRVVEAKAKGEPLRLGFDPQYTERGRFAYDAHDVESLVAQLCEVIVAGMLSDAGETLTEKEIALIDWGLGVLTSDYNDVPHDEIAALREKLRSGR